jgi:hypothetical protein
MYTLFASHTQPQSETAFSLHILTFSATFRPGMQKAPAGPCRPEYQKMIAKKGKAFYTTFFSSSQKTRKKGQLYYERHFLSPYASLLGPN